MDTPNNTQNTAATQENTDPSVEEMPSMSANGNNGQMSSSEDGESNNLQEFVSSIPWGKILLGVFVLFLLIWGLIYLFSGPSIPTTPEEINIDETKRNVAIDQANQAASMLGVASFNALLQPKFSLEPSDITADEPKIALLQVLGVLEQTLTFDVWAYLQGKDNREQALAEYSDKLSESLNDAQQWLATLNAKKIEVNAAKEDTLRQLNISLSEVNRLLALSPDSAEVITHYTAFVEANYQLARLNSEAQLLVQSANQAFPLLDRATIRKRNIELNRQAIINNIQVVDLDDPGLKLIIQPTP
ncbi:MAG: hypothetical protein HY817_00310 [Candidatus Abawacabacteria bacterium]|nr:hypothetical protein [Candidatus Abawacabacteria bacterium]